MKKLQLLFIVAIATLMVGNVYADGIGNVDLNNVSSPAIGFENYILDLNYKNNISANTSKHSDEFLGENITMSFLPNENRAGAFGANSGGFYFLPVMQVLKEELQAWNGLYNVKQINNIQFSVSEISKITRCSVWVIVVKAGSMSIGFNQEVATTGLVNGWNTVTLTAPYQITDDIELLCIGYSVEGTGPASNLDVIESEIDALTGYFMPNNNGQLQYYSIAGNGASWMIKAGVTAEKTDLKTNANLMELEFPEYVAPGKNFTFKFLVANWGVDDITSMEVSYKLGSEPEQTFLISNISGMASGRKFIVSSPAIDVPASFQTENTYPVVITITEVNGKDDEDMSNNTLTSSTTMLPRFIQRIVLHEGFTAATCPPCKQGNENLKSIQNSNPNKYATIKYQTAGPSPGDPYYTTEVGDRGSF